MTQEKQTPPSKPGDVTMDIVMTPEGNLSWALFSRPESETNRSTDPNPGDRIVKKPHPYPTRLEQLKAQGELNVRSSGFVMGEDGKPTYAKPPKKDTEDIQPKHPLLDGPPETGSIITLENYEKWYRIFKVDANGTVSSVNPGLIEELSGGECLWIDHCYHPVLLLRLAKYFGAEVSPVTLEVAAGRWVMEDHSMSVPFCYFLED